jgi:hypothetical protein
MQTMPLKYLVGPVLHNHLSGRVDRTTGPISNFLADWGKLLLTATVLVGQLSQLIESQEERHAITGKWN